MKAQQFLSRLSRRAQATAAHIRCSFCGRGEAQVSAMVSGPNVYICDACVDTATRIIAESRAGSR